jgi:hypothetical protein
VPANRSRHSNGIHTVPPAPNPGRSGAEATDPVLTPPQVGTRCRVNADKVLGWIARGELRAFNAAAKVGGRPRWRIHLSDLLAFEAARSATPATKRPARRSRVQAGVISFF